MKRIFRKIHLWLSIPFGLLFAVMCFSAAMLLLEPTRDLKVAPLETEPLHIAQIMRIAKASLPDSVEVTGVTVSAAPDMAYKLSLSNAPRDGYYVNQYTGEVLGRSERKPFFATMFKIHRWMGGSRDSFGKKVTGATTMACTVVLLTGIFIWIPKLRKSPWKALTLRLRSMRAFWVSLHISGGIYAALILLLCCLTGLTWSYRWYSNGVNSLFGVENTQRGGHGGHGGHGGKPEGKGRGEHSGASQSGMNRYLSYDVAMERVKTEVPDYKTLTITDGQVSAAREHWGNQGTADVYAFDTRSGEITDSTKAADAPKAQRVRGWIYTLHTAAWGGNFSKWLTFAILLLIGFTLPLTGYYIWYIRLTRPKKTETTAKN